MRLLIAASSLSQQGMSTVQLLLLLLGADCGGALVCAWLPAALARPTWQLGLRLQCETPIQ
jgi:hypothetical protein